MAEYKVRFFVIFLLVMVFSQKVLAHEEFISVISNAKPSVVIIEVIRSNKKIKSELKGLGKSAEYFEDSFKNLPSRGRGSGFIIKSNELDDELSILTAAHVVKGASKIKVVLSDGKRKTAKVVWLSTKKDVALLQVQHLSATYRPLIMSDETVLEGQSVLAIAGSFDLSVSSSLGIISAVDVILPSKKKLSLIQTDAAINPGASGGALLNSDGQVVGLISNIYTKTGTFSGTAFAVPSNTVKELLFYEGRKKSQKKN